jgi:asparaginyl-tRNA synthetase
MTIERLSTAVGQTITLQGWVMGKRTGKGLIFLIVRDGSGLCQCIVDENKVDTPLFEDAKRITQESSLRITGQVVADERQIGGYELHVSGLEIVSLSQDFPITPKEHGIDFLMDHRHLWLRSKRQWAIMRIRNTIIMAIHEFFQGEGFLQCCRRHLHLV